MKNSIRTLAMLGLAAGIAMAGTARADDAGVNSDNQTAVSQDQQDNMEDQIEALQESLGTLKAQQDGIEKTLKNWVNLTGDLRYRYEDNDYFNTPAVHAGAATVQPGAARLLDYERYRIRARLVETAQVNDFTTFVARLTTGSYLSGNAPYAQPNTANQTLSTYGDKLPLFLDKAVVTIAPQVVMMPTLMAGYMAPPFLLDGTNANLIFDDNFTDGGLAFSLQTPNFAGFDIRGIGAQFINEDGKTGIVSADGPNDSATQHPKFEGSQVVLDWNTMPMGQPMGLSLAAAYYNWLYVKGTDVFPQGSAGTYTNSVNNTTNNVLLNGYSVDDFLATYNTVVGGLGVKAFYEYETNTVVQHNNTGYVAGGEIASGTMIPWNKNEITLGYNYRRAETDSTLSIWNDGDFDAGGTDAMGGKFYANVMLGDGLWVSFREYNDVGNLQAEAAGGHYSLFQRQQVDLNAKF